MVIYIVQDSERFDILGAYRSLGDGWTKDVNKWIYSGNDFFATELETEENIKSVYIIRDYDDGFLPLGIYKTKLDADNAVRCDETIHFCEVKEVFEEEND